MYRVNINSQDCKINPIVSGSPFNKWIFFPLSQDALTDLTGDSERLPLEEQHGTWLGHKVLHKHSQARYWRILIQTHSFFSWILYLGNGLFSWIHKKETRARNDSLPSLRKGFGKYKRLPHFKHTNGWFYTLCHCYFIYYKA